MIDHLISTMAERFGVGEDMAKQAIGAVMKGLRDGGEADLADELAEKIPGLGDVSGGGLLGGMMGLFGGGSLAGLSSMIGPEKMTEVVFEVSQFIGENADPDLGDRFQEALTRLLP